MSDQEIRSAQEQIISSLGNDPDAGLSTSVVDASISDGLACCCWKNRLSKLPSSEAVSQSGWVIRW